MPARLDSKNEQRTVLLDKPIVFVGRHPECDLVISNSRKVSRKHCCLAEINGAFQVRDLGSTNGIQVNGKRVTGLIPLQPGDQVIIGDCEFEFSDGMPQISSPVNSTPTPVPPLSDDGAGYRSDDFSSTDHRDLVDHEMSSDIPVMIDEPEEDGFEVFGGSADVSFRGRKGSDSDSKFELTPD